MSANNFIDFLEFDLSLIAKIPADTAPKWGKMNLQQMIEHLIFILELTENNNSAPEGYDHERKVNSRVYVASDEPMPKEFKARFVTENEALRYKNVAEALEILDAKRKSHWALFEADENRKAYHPIFGLLDKPLQRRLHNKHFTHHFQQFGII